jgi:3-hydroxyacyl-CoA dehydrogenase
VPVLRLVELVTSLLTSPETAERAEQFATDLGKLVIHSKDRAGFVVNALLIPYILSAIRMMESGFASAEEIDLGMVEGCAHPMGPLALADLIGLDTTMAVAESLYGSSRNSCTRRRRCSCAWWKQACSGARPAAASTTTTAEVRTRKKGAGETGRPPSSLRDPEGRDA